MWEPGNVHIVGIVQMETHPEEANGDLTDDFARLSEPTFRAVWDNPLDADYDHL